MDVENKDGKVIKLPIDRLDTQNYIGASELVIAKAGWKLLQSVCVIK